MKHFAPFSIFVFIVFLSSLAACKTVRTSEKAVSESKTAAVTASRLTFYRTLDALSGQFNLSADSISIIFLNESPYDSRCFIFHTFIHLNNPCYHKKAFSLICS